MADAPKHATDPAVLGRSRPASILIVDDNEPNILILQKMLERLGYLPVATSDGKQAFSLVTSRKFDVILMDIMMPEINGLELTRAIRNSESSNHPTIIAVTADVTTENRDACFLAGVDDFLAKPVDLKSLQKLIATWIPEASG